MLSIVDWTVSPTNSYVEALTLQYLTVWQYVKIHAHALKEVIMLKGDT